MKISLTTHADRLVAIEAMYSAATVMEKATLIELANRLCREENYTPMPSNSAMAASGMLSH
jgi:hypothetical protein